MHGHRAGATIEMAGPGEVMTKEWDHSSHDQFVAHYVERSSQPDFVNRFRSLRDVILRFREIKELTQPIGDVLDVGCNAGAQCLVWAEKGYKVHGVDVNEPLLEVARQHAAQAGRDLDLRLGSADDLPWPDESMDVCLALELLEHVKPWQKCLSEFARVLRPGGVLFLTTSSALCPIQQEFRLPGYSWYPGPVKRHFEKLAVTSRPDLANYATYPAVNWFTPYGLPKSLSKLGFQCYDRFDIIDEQAKGKLPRAAIQLIRAFPPFRLLAHVCKEGTLLLAVRQPTSHS